MKNMITGGVGGGNTITGLRFESKVDFFKVLDSVPGYEIKDGIITFKGVKVAQDLRKNKLYKFLEKEGIDYKKILSKKLLPDDAIYVFETKTLFVVEIKFQKVAGSVDEKLQTCHFKKRQYDRLMQSLGIKVQYIYILSDWFNKDCYRDVLQYIKDMNCDYCFKEISLARLGLPIAAEIAENALSTQTI